jgi:hypothetical protein
MRRGLGGRLAVLAVGLAAVGVTAAVNNVASADPAPAAAGEFVPLTAASLVDTTSAIGWSGKLQPDATNSVTATGVLSVPATGVLAVMLHITTSHSASSGVNTNGNVWAWPAGAARPQYAVVANPPFGSVADNTAIVQVGSAGQISFHNGASGTAVDVRADVEGYVTSSSTPATGAAFAPLTPRRIIDTSAGTGGRSTPLTSAGAWTFHALGAGGLPALGVSAVALNVGARATSTNCWVQVQPAGTDTSNAAYPRVDTYANYTAQQLAVVAPNASGNITLSTNCAATDVYVDVEGYYLVPTDGSSGDVYVPITNPARVIDTRRNIGITGKMTAGRVVSGSRAVAVSGGAAVPSDADAVALNIGAINATSRGYNTIWTDGTAQPTSTSTIEVDPNVIESNLVFVETGARGRIDVADPSRAATQSNDLYVDIEGYFYRPASSVAFATPQYFPGVIGDTYYNTVGPAGDILTTANDTRGVNDSCTRRGSDIAILSARGADPARLTVRTVNCMTSYGPRAGGPNTPDGCSWKTGGITRIGRVVYLAVARQLKQCSDGKQANGLQPSFNASIIKSVDGGKTWTNPWGATGHTGAAPPYERKLKRYQAMFPGQRFSAPFFIQYGPGNTQTVDGANKYLYAVSNDGYAYDGNYLHLARVPLNKIQLASAWRFYHGRVGGAGRSWTKSVAGATRVLQAKRGVSQPAIQYVPALKKYVLVTFSYTRAGSDFPTSTETPYTQFRFYTAPKPWGPWTKVYDHSGQRSLWCASSPCQLTEHPQTASLDVGTPDDWLGLYDPSIVQKFVFTRPLAEQAIFTGGDWKNTSRYSGQALYRLHVVPLNLTSVLRS